MQPLTAIKKCSDKTIFIFFIFITFLSSCIKEVKLNYRTPKPTLVVEGLLLTDATPCKVTLSYSGLFIPVGAQVPDYINDATVFVKDNDENDSVQLVGQGNGIYVAEDFFKVKTGNSYSINITLSNGEEYASVPEKVLPVAKNLELDSIGVSVPHGLSDLYGADIQIRTKDPAGEKNYYRWMALDYVPREAKGVPCGSTGGSPQFCFRFCYQLYPDKDIRILSDANIDGNEIRHQTVLVAPYYYFGLHYVEIKQLSLSRQAYQFWQLYLEQLNRTGSILDPLPSPIQGNIYNVADPNKLALGYFEVSDVASKKYILFPNFINAYYTLAYTFRYIDPRYGLCWEIYPNAVHYAPPGWENLPETKYDVY